MAGLVEPANPPADTSKIELEAVMVEMAPVSVSAVITSSTTPQARIRSASASRVVRLRSRIGVVSMIAGLGTGSTEPYVLSSTGVNVASAAAGPASTATMNNAIRVVNTFIPPLLCRIVPPSAPL